jgi:PIN domain nuclease of toxin-antitoxin system
VRYVIDTHILIWAVSDVTRLSPELRAILEEEQVAVSAATFWEMAIKIAAGKLRLPRPLSVIAGATPFDTLPVKREHAVAVSDLPAHHRDPFDRILIAQAIVEGITLLTADPALACYGPCVRLV